MPSQLLQQGFEDTNPRYPCRYTEETKLTEGVTNLRQGISVQEDRIMLPPRVLLTVFKELDCAVFQVKMQPEMPLVPIQSLPVIPDTEEAQHLEIEYSQLLTLHLYILYFKTFPCLEKKLVKLRLPKFRSKCYVNKGSYETL